MKFVTPGAAAWARLTMMAALLIGAAAPLSAQETIGYTYDGQGQLAKVARSGTINNGVSECYILDGAGNRSNLNVATSGACVQVSGVSFSIASNGPVTEGSNSAFTITKNGATGSSLSVSYQTANGTAVAPGDYTAKLLTALTFLSTDVTKTINVTTATDALIEGNETFTMTLSAPTGGATIAVGTATATISDPVCAGVSFSIASNGAVTEGANSVFTFTKTGTTSSSCTVNYATADGTAVAPGDYTTKSSTLTFISAQTSQTVSVTTIDDTLVESAETFTMTLSAPSGGAVLGTATATATINDNDSAGNHAPVAVNDGPYSQAVCTDGYYSVLVNDSDADGDPLTITGVTGIGFSVSGTQIHFLSMASSGLKSGTYTISDGHGGSASATISVSVLSGTCA